MQIIGQEANLALIDKWKEMPPFVIIQGDEHTGKTYLTLYLCRKYGLRYKKISNRVDDVRSLINVMQPFSNTLYHFDNFHTASINAKNALLKVTEEPVPGNYIVITGGPQLKTLESRARRILMAPYSNTEIKQVMQPYFPEEDIQDALIECGINTPAKVIYYKSYEPIVNLVEYAKEIAERISGITPDIAIWITTRFENRYEEIDACLLFLTMLINILENKIKNKRYYSYSRILTILLNGKKELIRQPTLKRKMLLYKIFYEIYQADRGN